MDIRQLEALLAVAEEGSFTAAADRLHTVQSNVSGHVHQLEAELGVQLLVRSRRGTVPTEFGVRVIDRARAIRSEMEAMRKDLSMLQGLETGHATLGVVGTVSRSVVPALVIEMRRVAPGLSLRLTEGASERLAVDVAERVLASAVVTEPVADPRLVVEHLRDEDLVGLVPSSLALRVPRTGAVENPGRAPLDSPAAGQPITRRGRRRGACRARRAAGSHRGGGHPAHRGSRRVRRGSVDPARDRSADGPSRRAHCSHRAACHRAGSRSSPRGACSSHSPTKPCTTRCACWFATRPDRVARRQGSNAAVPS